MALKRTTPDTPMITTVTPENIRQFSICGYKNPKRPGYNEKVEWLLKRMKEGLQIKMLQSDQEGTQGMIEYVPGKFAWRPIAAEKYMVIHCLFVGFKKTYKGHGFATQLIQACEADAKQQQLAGVAVVVRQGSFMVGDAIFIKNGYTQVDQLAPDFMLLAKRFNSKTVWPCFKPQFEKIPLAFSKGLVIIRADQCPYTITNVREIMEAAQQDFKIKPTLIELKTAQEAQNSPCPFGTFGILYQGKVVAHHPISATRFKNIMKALK